MVDFGPMDYLCLFRPPATIEATDYEDALEAYLFDNLQPVMIDGEETSIGVWGYKIPQRGELPAVVYTTVTADPYNTSTGSAGLVEVEWQVDCYATTRKMAFAISDQVRHLLQGKRGNINGIYFACTLDNRFSEQEPGDSGDDASTWRTTSQYTVFYNESIPQF